MVRVEQSGAGHDLAHAGIVTCRLLQHLTRPAVISGEYNVVIARLPARENHGRRCRLWRGRVRRPDDERGRCYRRIFTARATTRIPTATEIICSAIIMSFAQGLTAETSAGLNASAVFTERCR